MRLFILTLLLFLTVHFIQHTPRVFAQNYAIENASLLDSLLNDVRIYPEPAIRGISAAIVFPDNSVWCGVSGLSHDTIPIDSSMLFGIGSVTKTITAAAVLQLVDEGKLSLDDSLHKWHPKFEDFNENITIRQLLNHTSGIPDHNSGTAWVEAGANPDKYFSPQYCLTLVGPAAFLPGEGWEYSSVGYTILGMIMNDITDSTLAEVFRTRFWDKYDLNHTYLEVEETVPGPFAHPWEDQKDWFGMERTGAYSVAWAGGGVFSTAEDLARWPKILFEENVLSEGMLNQTTDFIPATHPLIKEYGLGIEKMIVSKREYWGHRGSMIGYLTGLYYLPEHRLSLVLIMNDKDFPAGDWLISQILDPLISSVDEGDKKNIMPVKFTLLQNYPNPFNPSTVISWQLAVGSQVDLSVYNMLGEKIATLVSKEMNPGSYHYTFNGKNLGSGVYYYLLKAGEFQDAKKMILIK